MPRISVKTAGEPGALPSGMSGDAEATGYFGAVNQALQLHRIDLGAGRTMRLNGEASTCCRRSGRRAATAWAVRQAWEA